MRWFCATPVFVSFLRLVRWDVVISLLTREIRVVPISPPISTTSVVSRKRTRLPPGVALVSLHKMPYGLREWCRSKSEGRGEGLRENAAEEGSEKRIGRVEG